MVNKNKCMRHFLNLTRLPLTWLPCEGKPGFPMSHHGEDQVHQARSRFGITSSQGHRITGHRDARLPVQDHPGQQQGIHAPVPHECWRTPPACLGAVRGTDRRSGTRNGAGVAGRDAQRRATPAWPRMRPTGGRYGDHSKTVIIGRLDPQGRQSNI